MSRRETILPYISATTTSTIFGLSFLFSKKALNVAGPFELLSFRFLTAFLVMSLLILTKVFKVSYKNKNMRGLFLLGLTQPIVYFIFETFGIKFSSSSEAGLMIALIPIVVTLMAAYYLKEKPTFLQFLSIVCSVGGVALIVLMNGSGEGGGNLIGIAILMGAVISGAAFNIVSRKLSMEFSPMELTYFMMGLGAVFFNLISIVDHIRSNTISNYFAPLTNKNFIISIAYLGILSSIIAFFLINFTLSKIEASKSAIFANISTIVSIAAGVVILKEKFEYYHLIGSALILIGVWGTNYFGMIKEQNAINESA